MSKQNQLKTKTNTLPINKGNKNKFGEDQSKEIWDRLKDAIKKIHLKEASNLSFEELYRNAYNMILHKHGDTLYKGLKSTIVDYLSEKCEKLAAVNDKDFLKLLNDTWINHTTSMVLIRDILMYMDRTYIASNKLVPVYDLGLQLFGEVICRSTVHPIGKRTLESILSMIRLEREGEVIAKENIKTALEMLIQIGVGSNILYTEDFETPFIEATASFYYLESQQILENNLSIYLFKVEKRLKEEEQRVENYLDDSTRDKLLKCVENELIAKHMDKLIEMENTGLLSMIEHDKIDDMSRMYRLSAKVRDGFDKMKSAISNYIFVCGEKLNEDQVSSDPIAWVTEVMKMKDKYNALLEKAFQKDRSFQTSINDGFRKFISKNKRSAEFLSLFIDDKLKKGAKETSEAECEAILEKSVTIFRFLHEKDAFERYYKSHLAKRLLSGRSSSDESERSMIGKLKNECGYQFTSKLEGMFHDMKISEELMKDFKAKDKKTSFELSVNVLTMTFWPMSYSAKCNFPHLLIQNCKIFADYYHSRYTGRKLTWQPNLGSADIRAKFDKKFHELNVTTISMTLLLLFNTQDTYSYKEIKDQLEISETELKKNLLSLSLGKYKILIKDTKTKEIEETDKFTFNGAFTNNLTRIKVPLIVTKQETESEPQEVREKIEEERQHMVEACIVRVMKHRKQLDHNSLVVEVTKQLQSRFAPNPNLIKKRIEVLIDREFLTRSKEDIKTYIYVA